MTSSDERWGGSREGEDEKLPLKIVRDESNDEDKLESDELAKTWE